jgi:hypothetical protein
MSNLLACSPRLPTLLVHLLQRTARRGDFTRHAATHANSLRSPANVR